MQIKLLQTKLFEFILYYQCRLLTSDDIFFINSHVPYPSNSWLDDYAFSPSI